MSDKQSNLTDKEMEDLTRVYACPECGHVLGYKACIDAEEEDRLTECPECGQEIDWEEQIEKQ